MTGHWRQLARCTPAQAALFDELTKADQRRPDGGADRLAQAIAICNGCTVRVDCLNEAIEVRDSGVRGGVYLERGRIHHVQTGRADRRASILHEATR